MVGQRHVSFEHSSPPVAQTQSESALHASCAALGTTFTQLPAPGVLPPHAAMTSVTKRQEAKTERALMAGSHSKPMAKVVGEGFREALRDEALRDEAQRWRCPRPTLSRSAGGPTLRNAERYRFRACARLCQARRCSRPAREYLPATAQAAAKTELVQQLL